MDAIGKLVPKLLLESSENDFELTPERAAKAFKPEYISNIALKGSNPVAWSIVFNANIDQDIYGDIEGKDEVVEYATLSM